MFQKTRAIRAKSYRQFVASFECFACGIEGFSQAAHSNYGKGLGMKTCDLLTFPLCAPHFGMPGCHWQHDNCFDMTRDQRRQKESEYVAKMQDIARKHRRIEFRKSA